MLVWNKIKWAINVYVELRRRSYPLVNYGVRVLYLGFAPSAIALVYALSFESKEPILLFDQFKVTASTASDVSLWVMICMMILGVGMIVYGIYDAKKQARKTAKVLIVSMLGESARFPDEILYESEKLDSRETVKLGLFEIDDYISKSIEIFNAEKMVDVYHRFILHHDCKKVFLGGRARVPFLIAYGSCFRSISAKIVYFDQLHKDGKWYLLNNEDENISLVYDNFDNIEPNEDGDIGLALGFTAQIKEHQLPPEIKGHALSISPNIDVDRNLIKNQENLERVSRDLKKIIDQLSTKEGCKLIHLFLSIQAPMALELGRSYQEGTHKKWIIHNFDASAGEYTWAIKLSSSGIEKFQYPHPRGRVLHT